MDLDQLQMDPNTLTEDGNITMNISAIWLKGMFAMNLAIFVAVMIILGIQLKNCINECAYNKRIRYIRSNSRKRDKYGRIELTTDVTELEDDGTDAGI